MNDFGFSKGSGKDVQEPASPPKIDVGGLPRGPIVNDRLRERDAIDRAEAVGFTDRGQGRAITRRARQKTPSADLFIKGPEELIEWFIEYTNSRGHSAYWKSIEEFRALVAKSDGTA